MAYTKEEIAAELVWRYVEHVRETPDAETLSEEEIRELVAVMLSVAPTAEAVAEESAEARRAAVRARVQAVLAAGPPPAERRRPALRLPSLVPAWRFRVVCAAAALLAVALGTVGFWHHPPTRVVRVAFPREIRDVEAMDEATAHRLMPLMVRNELQPAEERNLMGHMLICPGCFDEYIHLKHRRAAREWTLGRGTGARVTWASHTSPPRTGTPR